jgi:hypothetical protein
VKEVTRYKVVLEQSQFLLFPSELEGVAKRKKKKKTWAAKGL